MSEISQRAQELLKKLIERYIREGQPISSKVLAEDFSQPISSATIRNIMADLEAQGYIHSPHTSAGRIPTPLGYRFFVDSLLTIKPLNDSEIKQVEYELKPESSIQSLVTTASSCLSALSSLAGVVTFPKRKSLTLSQVEFLPLSDNRILVILVLNKNEIQNRVIHVDTHFAPDLLQEAANFLNKEYVGKDLEQIQKDLIFSLDKVRDQISIMMRKFMEAIDNPTEQQEHRDDYVLMGQARLLDPAFEKGLESLRQLYDAFSEKRGILHLLDKTLITDGVQIYIGAESGLDFLMDYSVITAPYSVGDRIVGTLGVLGPTRMAYDKVIPIVDMTAKLLSAALNKCF